MEQNELDRVTRYRVPAIASAAVRPSEVAVAAFLVTAVAGALLLPPLAQDPAYHAFADQRPLLGVPRAADVLSNLAFVAIGTLGLVRLVSSRRPRFGGATLAAFACIALALVATGIGSAAYHVEPNDATLAWDRLPMTLGFAGIGALAVAQRVSPRAAALALPVVIALGAASVFHCRASGNLAPYAVVQFGTALGLVALTFLTRRGDDRVPWVWVIAWYALAKGFELADRPIYELTGGLVAGHALKHIAAALAGAAALSPLRRHG
jgi:hypothetical protein